MIRRGDIYFANLNPVRGREQAGMRPVLVVSVDSINARDLVVTTVAGTDAANQSRDYPTNVRISAAESGLPLDTVFLCYQIRSLSKARFPAGEKPAGRMPHDKMAEVEKALKMVLGIH